MCYPDFLTLNENLLGNCYLHPLPPPHIDAPLAPSEAYGHQAVRFQPILRVPKPILIVG